MTTKERRDQYIEELFAIPSDVTTVEFCDRLRAVRRRYPDLVEDVRLTPLLSDAQEAQTTHNAEHT